MPTCYKYPGFKHTWRRINNTHVEKKNKRASVLWFHANASFVTLQMVPGINSFFLFLFHFYLLYVCIKTPEMSLMRSFSKQKKQQITLPSEMNRTYLISATVFIASDTTCRITILP